ncbi:uncharacterized protein LOC129600456 [Paramacrobiotus metropolitanus]|uniref:uncharacterized protein LOC129600456 n=1 Tax=Paramacrobiotus metropolitanus TaxID=2943436 RepID=UPI002446421B|nr:uncharacterized protein LOC129600456 [Paramacrobiotus metropolitanus]
MAALGTDHGTVTVVPPCVCPMQGNFGRRSLLQTAPSAEQCRDCAANRYYLDRLATVFEIVNAASTFTGFGALIGYVDHLWTNLSLVSIFVWSFTIAIGTAQLDEHTTKPSTRLATANLFMYLLLFSVLTSAGPLAVIAYQFWVEAYNALTSDATVDVWRANTMPPGSVRQVAECDSQETLKLAQTALRANASSVLEGCRYESVPVVPTWQSLSIAKWTAYGVTLISLSVGVAVWLYGVHCYFARLRHVQRILDNGGYIDCIPSYLSSDEPIHTASHIGDPVLEKKLAEYFSKADADKESLEDFLERTINEICRSGQSELVSDLCGYKKRR